MYLNGADPLGVHFRRFPGAPAFTIVGVVNDIRRSGKLRDIRPQIYLSAAQTDGYPVQLADFGVRTQGDPHALLKAIQQAVWSIDKDQPITAVRTMDEIVDLSVAEQRFQMLLLTIFAGVAVLLAMIGVFGVLSYSVNQRMNEIGVRIALGARSRDVVAIVAKQGLSFVVAAVALGTLASLAASRWIQPLLYGESAKDPLAYAAVSVMMIAVAIVASVVPAARAARVDPNHALRAD
jgi:predicted lysophospholipase L1 biosynthesis ABC-type transport system permease subunit